MRPTAHHRVLLAPLLSLALLLCATAAPAREDAGTEEVPPAPIAVSEPDDQKIQRRLTRIFSQVEELSKVEVEVVDGVVRLRGKTVDADAKAQAAELAKKTEGVVYVDNDIDTEVDVKERIEPTLSRFQKRFDSIVAGLPLFGVALGVVLAFAALSGVVRRWEWPFRLFIRRRILRGIVQQIGATVVLLLGFVIALELMDATALVGAVLGAAGLAGIALGFAFRDIAENYLASILLGVRRPFSANDHVCIDNHEGKVVRLTMRETVLMTLEGNHLRLPNALVYKSVILNFTLNPLRRFDFPVGVSVDTDLVHAQSVARDTLLGTPGVVEKPAPFVRVEDLADSTVGVRVFGWIDQREADWFKVRSEAVRRVKSAFDAAGIEMPFPVHRVELARVGADQARAASEQRGKQAQKELSQAAHEVLPDDEIESQIDDDRRVQAEEDLLANDSKK
jgi:small conductance mechanosensitive channel